MRLRTRAFTLLIPKVRVFEDGVSSNSPEAKCDWARGGCAGAKSHPFKSLFPSLRGRGRFLLAGGEGRLGQGRVCRGPISRRPDEIKSILTSSD